jgi:hypothetical protein
MHQPYQKLSTSPKTTRGESLLAFCDKNVRSFKEIGIVSLEASLLSKSVIASWRGRVKDGDCDGEAGILVDQSSNQRNLYSFIQTKQFFQMLYQNFFPIQLLDSQEILCL